MRRNVYQRNSNGDHAIDPITLNKIHVNHAILLATKYYNIGALQEWLKSGDNPVLPHTGLPLTNNNRRRISNYEISRLPRCQDGLQPRTPSQAAQDRKIVDESDRNGWPSSTFLHGNQQHPYYCYIQNARDPVKGTIIPKVRGVVLDGQPYDIKSLIELISKDSTSTGSETRLPHNSQPMVTRHYETLLKQVEAKLSSYIPSWLQSFMKKVTKLRYSLERIPLKYKQRMVLRDLSLILMKDLIDWEDAHSLHWTVKTTRLHEFFNLKNIAHEKHMSGRR